MVSLQSSGQNLKKLLSEAEYDSVHANRIVYKVIDRNTSETFEGLEGTIGILKIRSKLDYFFIGEAKKFDDKGNLIATMKSDSLGYLLSYLESDLKDGIIFDCVYEYKKINGTLCRLEKQKMYYELGQLWWEGQRYLNSITTNPYTSEFRMNY